MHNRTILGFYPLKTARITLYLDVGLVVDHLPQPLASADNTNISLDNLCFNIQPY